MFTAAHERPFKGPCVLLFLLVFAVPDWASGAPGTDTPEVLQQQGIRRLNAYKRHFYETGDQSTLLPELEKAATELTTSYSGFLARKNLAAAALTAIKLGDIERAQAVVRPCDGCKVVFAKSHYDRAAEYYARAFELAGQAGHSGYQADALGKLAYTDGLGRGNLSTGIEEIQRAIQIAGKTGNKDDLAKALDTAAMLEIQRNDFNAAEEYLARILAIKAEVSDELELYYVYAEQGEIYLGLGMKCLYDTHFDNCYEAFKRARSGYEQAATIAQSLGYKALAEVARDSIQNNVDRQEAVVRGRERSLKNASSSGLFHPKEAKDVLVTQNFASGANPQARALIATLLKEDPTLTLSPDPRGAYVQGMLFQVDGKSDEALDSYLHAVHLLEQDRRKLHDEQARGAFLEDKIEIYYAPALQLLQRRRYSEAFRLLESSRSRAMADLLQSRSPGLSTQKEREFLAESEKLKTETALEQQKLFDLMLEQKASQAAKINKAQARVQQLQEEDAALQARITQEAPRLNELLVSDPISLAEAQRSAAEGNYDLLYYLVLEHAIILWHIGGTDVQVFNVFLPRTELANKVTAFRDNLTAPAHEQNAAFDPQLSRELFFYLIQPVLRFVKQRHLVIVPHEALSALPFQALQDPATNAFLGEQFQISYAPSATILGKLKQKNNLAGARLLALANPDINDSVTEVRAIGQLFPGQSKVAWQQLAGKAQLKAWISGYNVVHLSVHGEFNRVDPLLSRVQLAPSENDDGWLTATEMFGLPLAPDSVVVLSACESGLVEATHANEVLGIVRALLYAGANNMVLSSWEVKSNATAIWMQTFYKEARRNSLSESSRLAILAVKRDPKFQHPYYWAPFLLIGK
ncbi:MAG TPA: CHAT domain-containing protein [Candidatus Angelobacter sp.]